MVSIIPSTIVAPAVRTNSQPTQVKVVWGRAPVFDFEKGEFLFNGTGDLVLGNNIQSLVQRIRKSIITARYKWLIYNTPTLGYFGCELRSMLGRNYDDGVKINLAKKFARDAIIVDSRVSNVVVDASINADQLYINIQVILISGQEIELQQNWILPR